MSLQPPSAETVARARWASSRRCADRARTPLTGGLINQSFAVTAEDGEYVLQRVHPVFAPEVHENIRGGDASGCVSAGEPSRVCSSAVAGGAGPTSVRRASGRW